MKRTNDSRKEGLVVELPAQLSPKDSMDPAAKSRSKKLTVYSLFVMNYLLARQFPDAYAIGLMQPGQLHLEAHAEIPLLWAMVLLTGELLEAMMLR